MSVTKVQLVGNVSTGASFAGMNVVGVLTATSFVGSGSGLTGVGIGATGSINTSGIITAASFVGSGTNLTGLPSAGVGIQSASSVIGYGFTTLNFIGTGNTFSTNGTTVNVSIDGGGGATGGSTDKVFFENDQTVTTSYTLTANKNAMSAGPVAINTSVLVTIPSNSHWSIV